MPPVPDAGKRTRGPMQIQLNGEPRQFDCAPTVSELLEAVGLGGRRVAVEVNRAIVPKSRHSEQRLCEGDVVEIVQALGGG
jgi:sulfur carrier protein